MFTPMSSETSSTSLRILVVDDDCDIRDSMATVLRMYGFDVGEAASGTEALEALKQRAHDVALVDVSMSGMDGYELAVEVTHLLAETRPVLIALTGWGREEDRSRAAACGFDHFFVKPVPGETLRTLLEGLRTTATAHRDVRTVKTGSSPSVAIAASQ